MEDQRRFRATMIGGPASGKSISLMAPVPTVVFPFMTDKGILSALYRLKGVSRDEDLYTYVFDGIED